MGDRVAIVGVGWSGFRPTTPDLSYKELMYEAAVRAYDDAGVNPRRDIDSFVTAAEDFHEGTSIFDEYVPDQLGGALKPVHTITGDGLHALATGVMLIRSGHAALVTVEAHSKASNLLTLPQVTAYALDPVLNRPLGLHPDFVAGLEMNRYLHHSGTTLEQCAVVTVKNRAHALRNPLASYAADLSVDEALGGPMLAWPVIERQTARHADGAVVIVLASEARAAGLTDRPIWVLGVGWCNGAPSLESREWGEAPYVRKAAWMAYGQAGIRQPGEVVGFAEVDDTFAYKELQHLEALGLFERGQAGRKTEQGVTEADGDLPVNVSGGSLGVGNLLEANGLARTLEVVLQLRGEAGGRQLKDVGVGLAQSWRGVPTTSAAVAVLAN